MRSIALSLTAVVLLTSGFAAGFSSGERKGFDRGGEWALVQAGVLAREAGVFMPVYMNQGSFRVVIRQPRNLYKQAWQRADQQEAATGEPSPGVTTAAVTAARDENAADVRVSTVYLK